MSRIVVVYKSTYGATKLYAEHIAKELRADLLEQGEITKSKLFEYDTVVYGGGIYAGGIAGVNLIRKNFDQLSDKFLIVFSVGFTPQARKDILEKVINGNFNERQRPKIQFYHFPGRIDYGNLNLLHRIALAGKRLATSGQGKSRRTKDKEKAYGKEPKPLPLELTQQLIEAARKGMVQRKQSG